MRLVRQRAGIVAALRVAAMMEEAVEAIARVPSREATSRDMEDDNMAQLESDRIERGCVRERASEVCASEQASE